VCQPESKWWCSNATDTFTVNVSDGVATTNKTLAVNVTGTNDAPTMSASNGAGATTALGIAENTTAVTTVVANDADTGQILSYSLTGGADQARFIKMPLGLISFEAVVGSSGTAGVGVSETFSLYVEARKEADGSFWVNGVITDPGAVGSMPLSIVGYTPDLPAGGFWF
jgi:hypothetical protein